MIKKKKKALLIFLFLLSSLSVAQDTQTEAVEVFEAPLTNKKIYPIYPSGELARGEEGWVIFNFMVDEEGNAFEPSVMDSLGSEQFIKAALKALNRTEFSPANLSGEAVASSKTMRYTFMIEDRTKGARGKFVSKYKKFIKYLEKDEKETATKELSNLGDYGARSLYEEAYLNLAKYLYAVKYSGLDDQMQYLERALYFDNESTFETYLPKDVAMGLWQQLFVLQFKNYRFGEALGTYRIIHSIGNEEAEMALEPAVKEILKLRDSDTAYAISAQTDENGSWIINLFKDEFYLDKLQSNINEIKLRCQRKYLFFQFNAEMKYKIPSELGACQMEVIGSANTGFELVQL